MTSAGPMQNLESALLQGKNANYVTGFGNKSILRLDLQYQLGDCRFGCTYWTVHRLEKID